jgi:hypothetical protein
LVQSIDGIRERIKVMNHETQEISAVLSVIGDSELCYWQHKIDQEGGVSPTFAGLNKLGTLCKNVRRALVIHNLIRA